MVQHCSHTTFWHPVQLLNVYVDSTQIGHSIAMGNLTISREDLMLLSFRTGNSIAMGNLTISREDPMSSSFRTGNSIAVGSLTISREDLMFTSVPAEINN